MKKILWTLTIALVVFSACKKDDDDDNKKPVAGQIEDASVDASQKGQWSYYSLTSNVLLGTGKEAEDDNKAWFARKDWDIAINRYHVRTNSGAATSVGAKGGVFVMGKDDKFESVTKIPENVTFKLDEEQTVQSHGQSHIIVKSIAQVIQFKANEDGSLVMPPVYLPSPIYLFRSADGENTYKLEFTAYKNDEGASGHVKFKYSEIN